MNEFSEKFKSLVKGRTLVLIDAANLEQSVRDMFVRPDDMPDVLKHLKSKEACWSIDYKKLKEYFEELSGYKGISFYTPEFDSGSHQKFRYFLKKGLKFKLITKPLKEYEDHTPDHPHRKANFDVEIAVDAVFSLDQYDTLILFSGDCDFEYLVKFLRGNGKVVIGFSRAGHIAKELPPALSHYFDIANFRSEFLQVKAKRPESFDPGPRS